MSEQETDMGRLYIVATPIGNLADISERAVEVLNRVDLIAAEDTRHTRRLLDRFNISATMHSCHEHNEKEKTVFFLEQLKSGKSIALVSDAGTPLISDPGFNLVRSCRGAGIDVVTVPGPCALVAALSISGLPSDRFVFEGFLPHKSGARRQRLEQLKDELRTLVCYESSHRILATLRDMEEIFGEDRYLVIARELTKMYETVKGGTAAELVAWMETDANQQKGEFVVMIAGAVDDSNESAQVSGEFVLTTLLEELPLKQAASLAARITGGRKNELYQLALKVKGN